MTSFSATLSTTDVRHSVARITVLGIASSSSETMSHLCIDVGLHIQGCTQPYQSFVVVSALLQRLTVGVPAPIDTGLLLFVPLPLPVAQDRLC